MPGDSLLKKKQGDGDFETEQVEHKARAGGVKWVNQGNVYAQAPYKFREKEAMQHPKRKKIK